MATYFHGGSEIQADGLQTLYLMNPNYGYSDHTTQQPPNMFFFNSAAGNPLNPASVHHTPAQQSQHFMGVPIPAQSASTAVVDDQNRHEIPVLHGVVPRFHYNLWGSHDQNAAGNHPHGSSSAAAGITTAVALPQSQRGLSLSLSPQTRPYRSIHNEHEIHAPATVISPRSDDVSTMSTNGISGLQSVIMGSKYLKAAQKLLDEVVSVGKGPIKNIDSVVDGTKEKIKTSRESTAVIGGEGSSGAQSSSKHGGGGELTTAQRQEFQMKKAKLINMLEEVEQRYRQYHDQMQIVATSFEQVAGLGSAKSYTALALQTISKQFRCLKDAITAQIKATSKSLGEEDCSGGKIMEGSRLKFVDQQIRQQRAFQQMGMIQNNAWRPQRGLPERAVSVLRAWLFEHFLHPYPKDSDKHLLAKQTGLTRSQVSNWFINARVRLWKPMVEEMYTEEMKDQEQNGSDQDNSSKPEPKNESGSKSTSHQELGTLQTNLEKPTNPNPSPTEISNPTVSTSPLDRSIQSQPGFSLLGSSDMEWIIQRSPKKPRNPEMDMKTSEASKGSERQIREAYELIAAGTDIHASGFGSYPMGDLGRFSPEQLGTTTRFLGNGVSLTLGLPHCEQNYISGQNMSTLEMRNVDQAHHYDLVNGSNTTHTHSQPSHSSVAFENLNNIPSRKRFAAQLLPDFVA